jgi:hypothetical protein
MTIECDTGVIFGSKNGSVRGNLTGPSQGLGIRLSGQANSLREDRLLLGSNWKTRNDPKEGSLMREAASDFSQALEAKERSLFSV